MVLDWHITIVVENKKQKVIMTFNFFFTRKAIFGKGNDLYIKPPEQKIQM